MSSLGPVEPPRRVERAQPPRRVGERPHRDEHEGGGKRRGRDADAPRDDEPEDDLPHVDVRV